MRGPEFAMKLADTKTSSAGGQSFEHAADDGMLYVPGGTYRMGSDRHYPEEAPVHRVTVGEFWMDRTPVTNRQFRNFINATVYVTFAEIAPERNDYPGALPHMLKAGSLVFTPPKQAVHLRDWGQWWTFKFGANWRRPYGPRSNISGLDEHPVVHVAYRDVEAYARWAGKELPTEAEWGFAARGGLDGAEFAWGDEQFAGGKHMANTWQGNFPHQNLAADGFERTSPVTAFPANGYGLHDMIGNVWEWTADWYSQKHAADAPKACCIPENPRGGPEAASYDSCQPKIRIPRKVLKAATPVSTSPHSKSKRWPSRSRE
jgi:sulfatase modifying factor 1